MKTLIKFKQFNPNKPAKYGLVFKSINACRYPYTFRMVPYVGNPINHSNQEQCKFYVRGTEHTVKRLETDLEKHTSLSGRNISYDRLYNSISKFENLGWKLLTHPPYSPDLAPSDFHLFGPLKESMKGIHFQTDKEVKAAVSNWLRTQSTEFYAKGIDNLISRWNKCVAKEGDYVEK